VDAFRIADDPVWNSGQCDGLGWICIDGRSIITTCLGASLGLPVRRTRTLKWYFLCVDEAQRLRGVVLESLDQEQDAKSLARHAYRSRTQFYRLFRAIIEETPVAMRRRLLLERAAWQLSRTQLSVTDISLNANYGSLEAFTRAFRKAFRISPSLYRRMGVTHTHLHAANGIHHYSGKDDTKGACQSMDLFDIFSGQESWHTRRLLDLAGTLTDEQLDRPLKNQVKIFPWDGPDQSVRQILDRMVQTKEVWAAALTGASMPLLDNALPEDRTPSAMLARMEEADAAFHSVLTDVHNRSAWEDTFVDALCEPPETFTFGGTFAHVITFNFYRRMLAIDALRRLGVTVEGFGCPEEYLASLAST
jgi:AraC family transcriptional regulator